MMQVQFMGTSFLSSPIYDTGSIHGKFVYSDKCDKHVFGRGKVYLKRQTRIKAFIIVMKYQ
jgi:hypothetical protein